MKVFLCLNVSEPERDNPFGYELLRALDAHPEVQAVQQGTVRLRIPEYAPDVVHVQWPEALSGWREPTADDLERIAAALRRLKRQGILVATVHNEYPHGKDTAAFRRLYALIYREADGLIHMGEASRAMVEGRFPEEVAGTEHAVIPHGDYSWFPNTVSRGEARARFGYDADDAVFLTFGTVRGEGEVALLRHAFEQADVKGKRLHIASRLPHSAARAWRRYVLRWPFWRSDAVRLHEQFIEPDEVQHYLNAADVLFVPRKNTMNSGNVPLGLTFGRVVVGPATGVVGEVLEATGNPTFDPEDPASAARALEAGYALARDGHGEANAHYARTQLSWSRVAEMHVAFYRSLLAKRAAVSTSVEASS